MCSSPCSNSFTGLKFDWHGCPFRTGKSLNRLSNRLLSVDSCWGLVAEMGSIRDCIGHGSHLLGTVKRERFRLVVFYLDCLSNQPFFLSKGQSCRRALQPCCGEPALPAGWACPSRSDMWAPPPHLCSPLSTRVIPASCSPRQQASGCFPDSQVSIWGWTNVSSVCSLSTFNCRSVLIPPCHSLHLCLTLCHPMNCSLPGSSVHGILQARILEWVAISSSRGFSWSRDQTCISCDSCIAGRSFITEPPEKPICLVTQIQIIWVAF